MNCFKGIANYIAEWIHSNGQYYYIQNDYKRAITVFTRAAIFFPKENIATCLTNRSACHIMLGDYKSSLVDSRKAIEYDINHERAFEQVITACLHLGDLEAVDTAINEIKLINPNNKIILNTVNSCDSIKTMMKEAEMNSRIKNFEKAIEKIDMILKITTACENSILLRETYLNARKSQRKETILLYEKANRYYTEGKLENCIDQLCDILVIDPHHKQAKKLMNNTKQFKEQKESGNLYFRQHKFLKAYQIYREALKIDPTNFKFQSILHYNLAATNFNLLDYKQGVKDATAALKHDPQYIKAFVVRAKTYFQLKNYKESIIDCKSVLIIESNDEIETLLKKCRLEESNQLFVKNVSIRANSNFMISNFKECIINCKRILEIKEIFDIRKLLENAELKESNRIMIAQRLSRAQNYFKEEQYDMCVSECEKILGIQTNTVALHLIENALKQIRNHKSLSDDMIHANDLFNMKLFKKSKKFCNLVLDTLFIVEAKRDKYKTKANFLLEKIRKYIEEIMSQAIYNFNQENFDQCIINCECILNIEESFEARNLLIKANSEKLIHSDIKDKIERARKYYESESFKNCIKECNQILKIKEISEARRILKKIRELIDKSMERAKRNLSFRNFDLCIKECEKILNIEESMEARNLLSTAVIERDIDEKITRARKYYECESYKDCIQECNQILKIREKSEARQFLKNIREIIDRCMAQAKRNFNLEYFEQCIKNCEYILKIEDLQEAEDMLDSAKTEKVSKSIIDEGLNRARRFYTTKHYRECIKECKQLLKIKEVYEANNLIEMCEAAIEAAQLKTTGKLMESAKKFYEMKNYKKCLLDCYKILNMVEVKEARDLVKKIKLEKANRKYVNEMMSRAKQHYKNQNYKECISECEIILGIEDVEEAKILMEKAKEEMYRKHINEIMSRAKQNFKNEKYKECIAECLKVLDIEDLLEAKTLMKKAKTAIHDKVMNEIMERARRYFKNSDFKQCILECQNAIDVDQYFIEAKNLMESARLELENASRNFVKNKMVQAKLQFDKAEFKNCVDTCTDILKHQDVAEVNIMLKKSKVSLAYEKLTNNYEILEVPKSSDQITIKSSYYALSLRYHPDKHSKSTKEMRIYCENLYKKITNAYRALSKK